MAISMLKIRRPLGRLIFNMGIAIPGKTVFLIETAPWCPGAKAGRRSPFRWMNIDRISYKKYDFYSGQLQKIKLLFEKDIQLFNSWYELPMGRSHVSQSKKKKKSSKLRIIDPLCGFVLPATGGFLSQTVNNAASVSMPRY